MVPEDVNSLIGESPVQNDTPQWMEDFFMRNSTKEGLNHTTSLANGIYSHGALALLNDSVVANIGLAKAVIGVLVNGAVFVVGMGKYVSQISIHLGVSLISDNMGAT